MSIIEKHLEKSPVRHTVEILTLFKHWADVLDSLENPFRDRRFLGARLQDVYALAREYKPTFIMQVGSHGELYAQAASHAAPEARCLVMAEPSSEIAKELELVPLSGAGNELALIDLLRTEFTIDIPEKARVMLFINAHNSEKRPLMAHVIRNLIRRLPPGSLIVADSLYKCGHRLDEANIAEFVASEVLKNNNNLTDLTLEYCACGQDGSVAGLAGTHQLLKYLNSCGLALKTPANGHFAYFQLGETRQPGFDHAEFQASCKQYSFDVVDYYLAGAVPEEARNSVKTLYRVGEMPACARALFAQGQQHDNGDLHTFISVCQIRNGQFADALRTMLYGAHSAKKQDLLSIVANKTPHLFTRKRRQGGLSLFGLPKAFKPDTDAIQKNAFKSWAALPGSPEIFLLGDDDGTEEAAREIGARHIPDIARNEFNTPLLDSIFSTMQHHSATDILAYVNSDIILLDDFIDAIKSVKAKFDSFLMIGCRTDLDIYGHINFADPDWKSGLRSELRGRGCSYYIEGMDYFVFTPGLWPRIPAFALGRFTWDNWLVYGALAAGRAVIDASDFVTAVHQNHPCVKSCAQSIRESTEGKRNLSFMDKSGSGFYNLHATHELSADGKIIQRERTKEQDREKFFTNRFHWLKNSLKENMAHGRKDLAEAKANELFSNFLYTREDAL